MVTISDAYWKYIKLDSSYTADCLNLTNQDTDQASNCRNIRGELKLYKVFHDFRA